MSEKKLITGIDIGSISVSAVQLDEEGTLVKKDYRFHEGSIRETLADIISEFDLRNTCGIAVTSSTPAIIRNSSVVDSRISFITAAKKFHSDLEALLIVGGEKFGLALFDESGEYKNYRSNTSCAAGTGSFLDQQARRLQLSGIEEFSDIAYDNSGDIPGIASRCAVFAKTDLIHAQQEGYSLAEICDGLSYGLAKNIVDTLFNNGAPESRIVFAGGVSSNQAVVKHIGNMLQRDIIVDEYSNIYGAIGAALSVLESGSMLPSLNISSPDEIIVSETKKKSYYYKPLDLVLSDYPDFDSEEKYHFKTSTARMKGPVEIDIYQKIKNTEYKVCLGIDIGSTSTKAVLVDLNKDVLAGFYTATSGRPLQAIQNIFEAIEDIENTKKIHFDFYGAATTGSGRKYIGQIIGADNALDEITAHARAAYELDRDVDTIIEIGGQDAKFTTMRNGMVTFSIMNNVCAAGTGSFIEEQARKLGCPLTDYSGRAEGVRAPLSSDRCTVFMERDLNYYLSEGYEVNEVLASVLHSVRENYLSKVAVESNIGQRIFFQGATARNRSLVAAFEQRLGKPIMVSKFCHLTGALGSALDLIDQQVNETSFRGISIHNENIPVKTEVCKLCTNHCKVKIAEVKNDTVAFGFLCGRDYKTEKFIDSNLSGFNLMKARKKAFRMKKKGEYKDFTIGIPCALHLVDEMPLWEKFFDILSIKTITTSNYKDGVRTGKLMAGAEFCAPVSALHGHVMECQRKSDYVFLPFYLEAKHNSKDKNVRRHYCYYTQFSPSVISQVDGIDESKLLTPLVRSVHGTFNLKVELYKALKRISGSSFSFIQVSLAYDRAQEFYNRRMNSLKKIYEDEKSDEDVSVVLIGRPYTILSDAMNNGVPDIFGRLGVKTFYQDMLPESNPGPEMQDFMKKIHWNYASEILKKTEMIAKTEGVYPVLVTSFKCSPDSFVIPYFKEVMESYDKPYLILQLDEHDSSVGYETRIEAGIRSFKNHYSSGEKAILKKLDLVSGDVGTDKDIFSGKTVLLPNWDSITGKLLAANLQGSGIDARLLEETPETIMKSMSFNTGQCIPLNAVAQGCIDYINKYELDPANTVLWNFDSSISCNIRMYPYYSKKIFESYGNGMENIGVYVGEATFIDMPFRTFLNAYFAYMFGGNLRKIACRIRPYENVKGMTDKVLSESVDLLSKSFRERESLEAALDVIISNFEKIETNKTQRPKVAIFGDMYVRDNDTMNQDLIRVIEENGGEVIVTPYNEYMKIIAGPYLKKWLTEGLYSLAAAGKVFQKTILLLERKYQKYFNRLLGEETYSEIESPADVLGRLNVRPEHTGESMDNILKLYSLSVHYPDISLFVQTNPAFCCPSLVTEAMADKIEELTGVPVVTIEYDGTGGNKNDDVIPYLKYPRRKNRIQVKKAI